MLERYCLYQVNRGPTDRLLDPNHVSPILRRPHSLHVGRGLHPPPRVPVLLLHDGHLHPPPRHLQPHLRPPRRLHWHPQRWWQRGWNSLPQLLPVGLPAPSSTGLCLLPTMGSLERNGGGQSGQVAGQGLSRPSHRDTSHRSGRGN